jgi:hypothetical protein
MMGDHNVKRMNLALIVGMVAVLFLAGCSDDVHIFRSDDQAPCVPRGVYSITGDEAVYLYWDANTEQDLAGYRVYRTADLSSNKYYFLATVYKTEYVDGDVENGHTYKYGISAFDRHGNESNISDIAWDTPRPEGEDEIIQDYHRYPQTAGYDFSQYDVTHWESSRADIYLDYDDYYGVYFLCVTDDATDIQDFGYTDDLDDVSYSPSEGWSNVGWVEVISGHTYIVWTRDDHYAKLRVTGFTRSYGIFFDWAYQIDPDNRELAPRPPHAENYLRTAKRQADDLM